MSVVNGQWNNWSRCISSKVQREICKPKVKYTG